jgi:hypothetical protein
MHEVTMRMSDRAFESMSHFVQYNPDVDIIKDNRITDSDEFKLNADDLVGTATKIKSGDFK